MMASTVAAQTRDFARRFLEVVQELGRENWVAANDAFERTVSTHPDHPYVAYLQANQARKAGFSAAAERIRLEEFPQIERRKAGTRRNAPVFYRIARPDVGFSFALPYDVPASHPLRTAKPPRGNPMRRPPEAREARSPWRRRQGSRRPAASANAASSGWWRKLIKGVAGLVDRVGKAGAKRWR
jgi:hypothetical protein